MPLRRMFKTYDSTVSGVEVDRGRGRPLGSGGKPHWRDCDVSTLGGRVRHARIEAGLTVEKLATLTCMHRTNLTRLELNEYNKTAFYTMMRLAAALDVSLDYLAGFQSETGICPQNLK